MVQFCVSRLKNQELGPGKIGSGYNFEFPVYIFDKNLNSEVWGSGDLILVNLSF